MRATPSERPQVGQFLLDANADASLTDDEDRTALDKATLRGHNREIDELLLPLVSLDLVRSVDPDAASAKW
jgi:ankyrin repeat protein